MNTKKGWISFQLGFLRINMCTCVSCVYNHSVGLPKVSPYNQPVNLCNPPSEITRLYIYMSWKQYKNRLPFCVCVCICNLCNSVRWNWSVFYSFEIKVNGDKKKFSIHDVHVSYRNYYCEWLICFINWSIHDWGLDRSTIFATMSKQKNLRYPISIAC